MIDVDAEIKRIEKTIYAALNVKQKKNNTMTINMNLRYYGIMGRTFIVQGPRRSGKTTLLKNIIKNTKDKVITGGLFHSNFYVRNPNVISVGQSCRYLTRLRGLSGNYNLFVDEICITNKSSIKALLDEFYQIPNLNSVSFFSITDPKNAAPVIEYWYQSIGNLKSSAKETAAQQLLNSHRLTNQKDIMAYFYPDELEDLQEMLGGGTCSNKCDSCENKDKLEAICENCKHYSFLDLKCKIHLKKMNVKSNYTCKDFVPYK